MIERTDAAARDLGRVSRAAPLPEQGEALNQCAHIDGHYQLSYTAKLGSVIYSLVAEGETAQK